MAPIHIPAQMPPHHNQFLNHVSLNQDAAAPSGSGGGEGQPANSALGEGATPVGEVPEYEPPVRNNDDSEEG